MKTKIRGYDVELEEDAEGRPQCWVQYRHVAAGSLEMLRQEGHLLTHDGRDWAVPSKHIHEIERWAVHNGYDAIEDEADTEPSYRYLIQEVTPDNIDYDDGCTKEQLHALLSRELERHSISQGEIDELRSIYRELSEHTIERHLELGYLTRRLGIVVDSLEGA